MEMETNKLKAILRSHKLWLETSGLQGVKADLRGADLQNIRLDDANLCRADLRGADFENANLQSVNLRGAVLRGANLKGANLQNANLHFADFNRANLRDANLQNADLRATLFERADLRGATCALNLKDIQYFGFAKVSKEHLPWLALHRYWSNWFRTLKVFP
jgi:uncharacterized protein YjbI with pentapeptide repeats